MNTFSSSPDVVVVGAGAAGIAAGRALRRRGVGVLLVEARDRVGGRAWTVPSGSAQPFDLGCEWLHSADRNPLAALARDCGFALDKSEPPWRRPAHGGMGEAERQRFYAAQEALSARLEHAAAEARRTGCDRSASEFLDPACPFNALLGAISTYYNGAPLERVSVLDYDAYCDTEADWRVTGGYGTLIAALGSDLPIRSSCRVTKIDAKGMSIRVETDQGTIGADAVIVTVPTNVLVSGAIRFDATCDDHLAAAAGLPLGVADKLYLTLEDPAVFAVDTRVGGTRDRVDSGAYTLRPRGRPVIEGYFGGDYAKALEAGGLAAFADAARRELADVMGHAFVRTLKPIRATGWARDPLSLGSYSHALPGHAGARAILATPIEERIVFAGEATSPHFFSTAHGAYETGLAAARTVAAYLVAKKKLVDVTSDKG